MTLRKLLPCSGIALVLLIAFSVVLGGSTPSSTADGTTVASYYDAHQARLVIVSFLFGLAAFAAVLFASWLARSLRSDEGTSVWDRVLVGGGVMFASALGLVGAANFAIADSPKKVSAPALQALNLLLNDSWVFWNAALGVFMLGAAGACLTSAAAYRWLGGGLTPAFGGCIAIELLWVRPLRGQTPLCGFVSGSDSAAHRHRTAGVRPFGARPLSAASSAEATA